MAENCIRIGRVSSVNYGAGTVRVTYPDMDDSVTSEFPLLNVQDKYKMPKVGSNVLVVHLSNGQAAGICLGNYWNSENPPKESGPDIFRQDMDDGDYIADRGGAVEIKAKKSITENGGKTITENASDSITENGGKQITLNAQNITFTCSAGTVTVAEIIEQLQSCPY